MPTRRLQTRSKCCCPCVQLVSPDARTGRQGIKSQDRSALWLGIASCQAPTCNMLGTFRQAAKPSVGFCISCREVCSIASITLCCIHRQLLEYRPETCRGRCRESMTILTRIICVVGGRRVVCVVGGRRVICVVGGRRVARIRHVRRVLRCTLCCLPYISHFFLKLLKQNLHRCTIQAGRLLELAVLFVQPRHCWGLASCKERLEDSPIAFLGKSRQTAPCRMLSV